MATIFSLQQILKSEKVECKSNLVKEHTTLNIQLSPSILLYTPNKVLYNFPIFLLTSFTGHSLAPIIPV